VIWTIVLDKDAEAYLYRLGTDTQERIEHRLDELARDPFGGKRLTGSAAWSARVGDYRIIYDLDVPGEQIIVRAIGPRGRVYRDV
jgi:mRNA interferase RelE/StbE